MENMPSKTIVFITGAFVHHSCWKNWEAYFTSQGYNTHTPPWPYKAGSPEMLRSRQPDPQLAGLTLDQLTGHFTELIRSLPERPILIGHSFGGLLVQILLNKGLAVAGIAIHSVPPQGVVPFELSFLRSNGASLGFFTSINKPYMRSFKSWQYAFTNGMTASAQKSSYEGLCIPESKRLVRGALSRAAAVDFKKAHNPLLIMAGSNDHCIPASLNERNYRKYRSNGSIVGFVVREGRNHFVLGLPTWKEDAQFIYDWLQSNCSHKNPCSQ